MADFMTGAVQAVNPYGTGLAQSAQNQPREATLNETLAESIKMLHGIEDTISQIECKTTGPDGAIGQGAERADVMPSHAVFQAQELRQMTSRIHGRLGTLFAKL